MIVVDSAALIAIFEQETDAARYETAIREADRLIISAVNVHESGIAGNHPPTLMATWCAFTVG